MKKNKRFLSFATAAILSVITVCASCDAVKAAEQDMAWNYNKKIVQTDGAFTYHAYVSWDETRAWIHKIEINQKKKHDVLSIPEVLDNKQVVRLGYTAEPYDFSDDDYYLV